MAVSTANRNKYGGGLFSPIRIKTPPKQVTKPRRSYSPSWTKRGELKREDLMSRKKNSSTTPHDIVTGISDGSYSTPRSPAQLNSGRHQLLEQQYQDLRKLLSEKNELIKLPNLTSRSDKSAKTIPGSAVKSTISGKSTLSTRSEMYVKESVSVKDLLQSSEYGLDHFSKHLSCVKKLAKRYRRHRRPNPRFKAVIEVIE